MVHENKQTITTDKLEILNSHINVENDKTLYISAFYRSHDLTKSEFI